MHVGPALALLALRGGLDAKWTPNGEAPAPYSTNARQQMGMDQQAMAGMAAGGAGAAPAPAPGATLHFNLIALLVMYICNNWKVVIALQEMIMKLLSPVTGAIGVRKELQAKQAASAAAATAREARLARLRASTAKAASSSGSAGDDDE